MTMSFSKSTLFFGLGLGLIVMTGGAVRAQGAPEVFKICQRQTYALCALANCFVMDGVSYCKCDVKFGNSISEPFNYGKNQDVCTTNAEGVENGYMVSTYSYPEICKRTLWQQGALRLRRFHISLRGVGPMRRRHLFQE